jgi:hypothetical protein
MTVTDENCIHQEIKSKLHLKNCRYHRVQNLSSFRRLLFQNVFIYLFTYSLFNDAVSISDYIASNERMIVNNELERMWKETVVA